MDYLYRKIHGKLPSRFCFLASRGAGWEQICLPGFLQQGPFSVHAASSSYPYSRSIV